VLDRQGLGGSRIPDCAGRDAADTAFLDNHNGGITLNNIEVTAVIDGYLPTDSLDELVSSLDLGDKFSRRRQGSTRRSADRSAAHAHKSANSPRPGNDARRCPRLEFAPARALPRGSTGVGGFRHVVAAP
jgi:hypothetical protein